MNALSTKDVLKLASEAFAKKDLAEAERLCRQAMTAERPPVEAVEILAEVLVATGRMGEAVPLFRRSLAAVRRTMASTSVAFGLATLRNLGFRPRGIIDVGAYQGEWARRAHRLFPGAHFLMIEPQPKMAAGLQAIVAASSGQAELRQALLGSERRASVEFFQIEDPDSSGSSLYPEQSRAAASVIKMPMLRLDDIVAEYPERKFELLKLDVQGAELDVLKGAAVTLAGVEAVVVELSTVEFNRGAPLFAEMVAAMDAYGFAAFDLYPLTRRPSGALIQLDAIFLRKESPRWPRPPFM